MYTLVSIITTMITDETMDFDADEMHFIPLDHLDPDTVYRALDIVRARHDLLSIVRDGNISMLTEFIATYGHDIRNLWGDDNVDREQNPCACAAKYGHLDCLQYLHEHGCPLTGWACTSAAVAGHLGCLQYIHQHGKTWNWLACVNAGERGHLECVKYMYEHTGTWDDLMCAYLVESGELDCLRYVHEHGGIWKKWPADWMTEVQVHPNCIQYVNDHCTGWI